MNYTITCIGSGNMGSALMKAAARVAGGAAIALTDADRERALRLAEELGGGALAANIEAAAAGRFVFLAVKPQVAPSVLGEIAPVLTQRFSKGNPAVLVSIVAGLSIATMKQQLAAAGGPADQPIIRLMPNTPALVARGMIALAASSEVPSSAVEDLTQLLSLAGIVDQIDERYMDAVTALSGSGPAFVYLFIEALADAGVRCGLSRDKALRYASRTVLGSAAMVEETGKHPGLLKDEVASPAGTTIAGIAALEAGAFRGTVMAAVDAAWKRARELG
ncbi:MAG: pyrroline-5-carboxylate reductase [Termitinemataceae bacterium]